MRIFSSLLATCCLLLLSFCSFGQNGFSILEVDTDSFPDIKVDFNLRDPTIKASSGFILKEDSLVEFSLESYPAAPDSGAHKNVLILVENLNQSDRLEFYKQTLVNALPFMIESGDKFNIAVFDRVRENGKQTIFMQLDDYTDDRKALEKAVQDIQPIDDILGNNKSSHLYHAIYEGLTELKEKFKDNRFLILLSTAYNNPHGTQNSLETSQDFAKEHDIPVYSVQYLIPNGEAHRLTSLVNATYGKETLTDVAASAANALTEYVNDALPRSQGVNYSLTYQTSFPSDGKTYKSLLSLEGRTFEIPIQTEAPQLWEQLWSEYLYYTIGGIVLLLLLLFLLIRSLMKRNKREAAAKRELSSRIQSSQAESDKNKALLEQQNRQLHQLEQEKLAKEQAAQQKIRDEKLLIEMKKAGPLPVISFLSNGATRNYKMDKPIIRIGRGKGNDIVVNDMTVSREHAELYFSGGTYFIRDMSSKAGTLVNGQKTEAAPVKHNDTIQLGNFKLSFIR